MISEDILEELKCAASNDEHFIVGPITLPRCGHSICKKCIPKDDIIEIECKLCGLISKQDFRQFEISRGTQRFLQIHLEGVFKIIETDISLKLTELKGYLH